MLIVEDLIAMNVPAAMMACKMDMKVRKSEAKILYFYVVDKLLPSIVPYSCSDSL